MKALLIIDMQKVSFTPITSRYDAAGVTGKINQLSRLFRKRGDRVLFIQHDGSREAYCIPGTEEWKLLPSLLQDTADLVISKTANDAFYRSRLSEILHQNQITELVITGCATDFCVDATIKSGLSRDYDLTVISDAHTTADRPFLSATQVISHYNWMWGEMAPTNGRIRVMEFQKYMQTTR